MICSQAMCLQRWGVKHPVSTTRRKAAKNNKWKTTPKMFLCYVYVCVTLSRMFSPQIICRRNGIFSSMFPLLNYWYNFTTLCNRLLLAEPNNSTINACVFCGFAFNCSIANRMKRRNYHESLVKTAMKTLTIMFPPSYCSFSYCGNHSSS